MLPFDFERLERPDDNICIFHNVTMLKWFQGVKKGEYFTKVKFNVDQKLIEFFSFDKILFAFYLELDFMELETTCAS